MEALWDLLDKIDTSSDIWKPTIDKLNVSMGFYNNVMRYASERFKYMKSDGYKLYANEEYSKLPKHGDKDDIYKKNI